MLIAGLTAAALPSARAAGPQRIVSINLCADQLLLMLAEPRSIASVTYLATNPAVSPLADLAQRIPENYGLAEEVLPYKPDLVLASAFTVHSTNALLRKLGVAVLEIKVAGSLEDIRDNIRSVAAAIGNPDTGARLLAEFDRRLAASSISPAPPRAVAALYRENNILYGTNTIAGTFTKAAGLDNLADLLGLKGFSDLPLEILIEQQPDIVIAGTRSRHAARGILAYRNLHHPALAKLLDKRALVRIPDRLWACGSPAMVEAVTILATVHLKWRDQALSQQNVREQL